MSMNFETGSFIYLLEALEYLAQDFVNLEYLRWIIARIFINLKETSGAICESIGASSRVGKLIEQ